MGNAETTRVQIRITGMHCKHCVHAVEVSLNSLSGVRECRVTIGNADVIVDPSNTKKSDLLAAIRRAGNFDAVSFSQTESA